ncbi:MAG: hypothetical protein LBT52_05270 [Clostridiales Family XIII bacterium]|jgi:hypothetical protein|nr:hypothetical protein [Clostridiales Family XIII bacterium]
MSLSESGESNGTISLHDLFEEKDVNATCSLTLEDFASILVRGGWPASVTRWGAVEIKFGQSQIEKGVNNLLKIKELVRSQHGGEATFLMVLTSESIGYQRDDGVYIVPVGCLKP